MAEARSSRRQGTEALSRPLGEWLTHPWLTVRVQIALGAIFVVAALPKILDPPSFAHMIYNYRLVPGAAVVWLLAFAWSHALLSLAYLLALTTALHGARSLLLRRKVRRSLDLTTGAVLVGFSARLATQHT